MEICDYWPLITAGISAAVGIGCWYGSQRYSLARDIRKEWNDNVDLIRPALEAELAAPHPLAKEPNQSQITRFVHRLPARQRGRFREAFERYKAEKGENNEMHPDFGFHQYSTTAPIEAVITELLAFMQYK